MKLFRIELFGYQTNSPKLRLFGPDGTELAERTLPADAASWIQEVNAEYSKPAVNVNAVGRKLYDWLDDSAERWFSKMSPAAGGVSLHLQFKAELHDLPWELMCDQQFPVSNKPADFPVFKRL